MARSSVKKNPRGSATTLVETESAVLQQALALVLTLPRARQDAIGAEILEELRMERDPSTARFQRLVEIKYTRGLTSGEATELAQLETSFQSADEEYYRPIIERAKLLPAAKTRSANRMKRA